MLDATVLEAVKKWRYRPRYKNGKPVEAKTQIVVEFSITIQYRRIGTLCDCC